jgi:ribosomal protein S18 acetylase RimI-like enzyme
MSSLPVASQIEVLDLRHFSARQLRPLLEAEAAEWQRRLRWDYRSSTELLLQYLESRILHGFVALDAGRICGYTFCVYEGRKAVIGDAFASGHRTLTDAETTRVLLTHILDMLRHSPTVDRVESQLLLFNAGEFAGLFTGPEFAIYPRLFLQCPLRRPIAAALDLTAAASRPQRPEQHEALDLLPWTAQDYQPAGELIHACYIGHTDAEINDQYRTLHGSLRFLHNIVRFPGCGTFEAAHSWTLRDRSTGALVGMVLCSRVAPDVAHITQLCIAPAHRGRGLGLALLRQSEETLRRAGFDAITLTVTEANQEAVNLYARFGFTRKHRFDAMALNTKYKHR